MQQNIISCFWNVFKKQGKPRFCAGCVGSSQMNLMVSPNPLLTRKQVNVHNCPQHSNNTIVNFPMEILQLNLDKFQRCTQSAFRDKRKGRLMLALGLGERQIYLLLAATYLPSWALTPRNFVTILCISQPLCSLCVISQLGLGETLCLVSSLTDTDTGAASPGTVRNSLLIVTMSFT